MADTPPAGAPTRPTRDDAGGSRSLATLPAREGQPIADVPPLIEIIEFVESPIEPATPQPPAPGQRPVRRTFLAPISHHIDGPPPLAHLRTRADVRPSLPLLSAPAIEPVQPAISPLASPGSGSEAAPPAGHVRRWPRRAAVAAGVTVALGLAVAPQLGLNLKTLHGMRALVVEKLAGASAQMNTGEPPADPVRRAAHYADRAKAGDASAQLALAVLYARGDGVEQDYAVAAKWFRAAAEAGVMRAQYDLGILYERGRGVPLDYPQAVAWYRKAAEQNHPLAQYNLAVAHTKGQGVRRDFFEAAVWYHRAAAQGVVAAMVNLAILYERGEGVDGSTVDAYAWYRAAARRGSQPAARRAEELLQAFSPVEQSRATAKTADVNASIRDAIGDRARLAAKSGSVAPAATEGGSAAALKSGIEPSCREAIRESKTPRPNTLEQ